MQVPTFSYPRFVQLLKVSCYSKYVVSGLVISIGGLQESLRKASLSALLDYLQNKITEGHNDSKEPSLSMDILWILHKYQRCDRVIVPTLKVSLLFGFIVSMNDMSNLGAFYVYSTFANYSVLRFKSSVSRFHKMFMGTRFK